MARSQTLTVQGTTPQMLKAGEYELRYHLPEWAGLLADIVAWFRNAFEPILDAKFVRAYTEPSPPHAVAGKYLWQDKAEVTSIDQSHIDLVVVFRVASPDVATSTIIALALIAVIVIVVAVIVITLGPVVVALGIGLLILIALMAMGVRAPERREERERG